MTKKNRKKNKSKPKKEDQAGPSGVGMTRPGAQGQGEQGGQPVVAAEEPGTSKTSEVTKQITVFPDEDGDSIKVKENPAPEVKVERESLFLVNDEVKVNKESLVLDNKEDKANKEAMEIEVNKEATEVEVKVNTESLVLETKEEKVNMEATEVEVKVNTESLVLETKEEKVNMEATEVEAKLNTESPVLENKEEKVNMEATEVEAKVNTESPVLENKEEKVNKEATEVEVKVNTESIVLDNKEEKVNIEATEVEAKVNTESPVLENKEEKVNKEATEVEVKVNTYSIVLDNKEEKVNMEATEVEVKVNTESLVLENKEEKVNMECTEFEGKVNTESLVLENKEEKVSKEATEVEVKVNKNSLVLENKVNKEVTEIEVMVSKEGLVLENKEVNEEATKTELAEGFVLDGDEVLIGDSKLCELKEAEFVLGEYEVVTEVIKGHVVLEVEEEVKSAFMPEYNTEAPQMDDYPLEEFKDLEIHSVSNVRSTLLQADLILRPVDVGQNIYNMVKQKYESTNREPHAFPWCSKGYAFQESTKMSSFSLAQHNPDLVGTTDFIGDAECFKKLIKMSLSTDAVSLILHRIGNTIMVDDFDLSNLLSEKIHSAPYQSKWHDSEKKTSDWESLETFALGVIERQFQDIKGQDNTMDKAQAGFRLQDLFYKCLENDMEFKPVAEPPAISQRAQPLKINVAGSDTNFLNTAVWEFGRHSFLIGSQVPTFQANEEDSSVRTTIGINNMEYHEYPTPETGIDLWLNNLMLEAEQTYLCHQAHSYITKTELMRTEEIPSLTGFDPLAVFEKAELVLDFIKTSATKPGTSYWIYKAPKSTTLEFYDIPKSLSKELQNSEQKGAGAAKPLLNPFMPCIGSILYRMCCLHKDNYPPRTLDAMLRHILSIFPPKKYPMIAMSTLLIYLDTRIDSRMDPMNPRLKFLNGFVEPGLKFPYEWERTKENDLFTPAPPTPCDQLDEAHLLSYKILAQVLEPELFGPFLSKMEEACCLPSGSTGQFDTVVLPLHMNLDRATVPGFVSELVRRNWEGEDLPAGLAPDPLFSLSEEGLAALDAIPRLAKRPQPFEPDPTRLLLSLESFEFVEPMDTSAPLPAAQEVPPAASSSSGGNGGKRKLKAKDRVEQEIRKILEEIEAVPPKVVSPTKTSKKQRRAEAGKASSAASKSGSSSPRSLKKDVLYGPTEWLFLCESKSLIRILSTAVKLMKEVWEIYNPIRVVSKKSKRLEAPPELADMRKHLFTKICLFLLSYGLESFTSKRAHHMMARYCARAAIFFNHSHGEARVDIRVAAWLLSGHALVGILQLSGDHRARGGPNVGKQFESDLQVHCKELMDLVALAQEKRILEKTNEFKDYELYPRDLHSLKVSLVAAYAEAKSLAKDSPDRTWAYNVSSAISKNLSKAGKAVFKAMQSKSKGGETQLTYRSKAMYLCHTLEHVVDIISYLELSLTHLPAGHVTKDKVKVMLRLAEVHYYRTLMIPTRGPNVGFDSDGEEACIEILQEILRQVWVAIDLFEKEASFGKVSDPKSYDKARWHAFLYTLNLCNTIWFVNMRVLDVAGDRRRRGVMLDYYRKAVGLMIDADRKRAVPEEAVRLYKVGEMYEGMGRVRRVLATSYGWHPAQEQMDASLKATQGDDEIRVPLHKMVFGPNPLGIYGRDPDRPDHSLRPPPTPTDTGMVYVLVKQASRDLMVALQHYILLGAPTLCTNVYLKYVDCKLHDIKEEGTARIREELTTLCRLRPHLRLYNKDSLEQESKILGWGLGPRPIKGVPGTVEVKNEMVGRKRADKVFLSLLQRFQGVILSAEPEFVSADQAHVHKQVRTETEHLIDAFSQDALEESLCNELLISGAEKIRALMDKVTESLDLILSALPEGQPIPVVSGQHYDGFFIPVRDDLPILDKVYYGIYGRVEDDGPCPD